MIRREFLKMCKIHVWRTANGFGSYLDEIFSCHSHSNDYIAPKFVFDWVIRGLRAKL